MRNGAQEELGEGHPLGAEILRVACPSRNLRFQILRSLIGPDQSLELSALVLFILGVLFVFGAGRLSADYLLFGPGSVSEQDHLERRRAAAASLKARIAELDEQRRAEEDIIRSAEETGIMPEPPSRADRAQNVTRVAKTLLIVAGASLILALGIEALPFRVTATQIAITAGMLFLIVGFFFLFFSWALNDRGPGA